MKQNKVLEAVNAVIVFICTTQLLIGCSAEKDEPQIQSNSSRFAVKGQTFTLTCLYKIPSMDYPIGMSWTTPLNNNNKNRLKSSVSLFEEKPHFFRKNVLTVTDAQENDSGNYKCIVDDHYRQNIMSTTYSMKILENGNYFLNISEPNDIYKIHEKASASNNVIISVSYASFPDSISFEWYNATQNSLISIQQNNKCDIINENERIILIIKNVTLEDTGNYTLKANNGFIAKELNFSVYIEDKPTVAMAPVNGIFKARNEAKLRCTTHGYPPPQVVWTYAICNIKPKLELCTNETFVFKNSTAIKVSEIRTVHELNFNPDRPGKMQCTARNDMGSTSKTGYVLIGEFNATMKVYRDHENLPIARGDEVIITCAALVYYFSADLHWFKDNKMIKNSSGIEVETTFSDYFHKKVIKFKNIGFDDAGNYECRAGKKSNNRSLRIVVNETKFPSINETNLGKPIETDPNSTLDLFCVPIGLPKPKITWFKDDIEINSTNNKKTEYRISVNDTALKIFPIIPDDEGVYKCNASSRLGSISVTSEVKVTGLKKGWIIVNGLIVNILIIIIIYWGIRVHIERKFGEKFRKGHPALINYKIPLNSQALNLPFDDRYEIDPNFDLGKLLGKGHYGQVFQAIGVNGNDPNKKIIIGAVKTVNQNQCPESKKESFSTLECELKIMVHLGKHLNVVGLLGAVTKNIRKGELMVLTEYCPGGDLKTFLSKHRNGFINQIDPDTDQINENIVEQLVTPGYVPLNCNVIFNTLNLVQWAYQVACGMKHLSSKNVLHNDLAARNILLCNNNVVKICDFGLSRSHSKGGFYHKKGSEGMSIKWVALEALNEQTFNTYTDVWSFGIVLWEFFSLAKEPYRGINNFEDLKKTLNDGYRMAKPLYANKELYEIMWECWSKDPNSRPDFDVLKDKFAKMLKDEDINHLNNLNEEFLKQNNQERVLYKMAHKTPRTNFIIRGLQYCLQRIVAMCKYAREHEFQSSEDFILEESIHSMKIIMSEETERFQHEDNEGCCLVTDEPQEYEQMNSATGTEQYPPTTSNNLDSLLCRHSENDGLHSEEITTPQMFPDVNVEISDSETDERPGSSPTSQQRNAKKKIITNENYVDMKTIKQNK